MSAATSPPAVSRRRISTYGLAIALLGAVVQLALSAYYLYMAHDPHPHDLPVGVVAAPARAQSVTKQLEENGTFKVTTYPDTTTLRRAIRAREAYGGVHVPAGAGAQPALYVASAAAPAVANLLKASFDDVFAKQLADQVAQATASTTVPSATVKALTTPPTIADVVPLPKGDPAGGSLGLLIQALCLGGSVAALGLGRLGPLTRRSYVRGVGHVALLVVYAVASAGVVLLAMGWFGVGTGADKSTLFWDFAFVSLALTASTSAVVALIGPAGAGFGILYFTLGIVISGASIAPQLLPGAGRAVGQLLPPGAGATAVRDSLYFPEASTAHELWVLGVYAGIGLLVIMVTNALPNKTTRRSTYGRHRP